MGISLSHDRYEEIKRIVVNLFVKYNVTCVPVSGFELATKMGIKVVPYSAVHESQRWLLFKKSEDGFCTERADGQWFIHYNDLKDYRRINNTIFHEIGHIVLDHSEDSELAEKEVKFFAKYALVPPVLVHKLRDEYLEEVSPEDISNIFEVSFEAACYALSYYNKWLQFGSRYYTDYEMTLLNLFPSVA